MEGGFHGTTEHCSVRLQENAYCLILQDLRRFLEKPTEINHKREEKIYTRIR